MANFFTRLAERSLGLSPVVQPTIASRFSSPSALPDAVNPVQPISPVQAQLSTPERDTAIKPNTTIKPIQAQAEPEISLKTSLSNQLLQSSSTQPEPNSKQPLQLSSTRPEPSSKQFILPATDPIAPSPFIGEKSTQVSLEPFRVLHQSERIPVESHPLSAIGQLTSETQSAPSAIPANSSSQQDALVPVPVSISQPPVTQQPSKSDRHTENRSAPSAPVGIQPALRSIAPSSEFSQAPVDRELLPPTIRVSIGRVEVRAIMPTAPAPKVAPVRPRPAVSLNDYLKQRGDKS